ncbi:MAG: glycosyltransferase, partial [Cyanobacteria bacterium P01_A01_bin.83]
MLSSDTNLPQPPTFPILNLRVHLLDNYIDWLVARLNQRIGTHVVTLNAEMSMMAQENEALSQAISTADLVIPDGAGIIVYMR